MIWRSHWYADIGVDHFELAEIDGFTNQVDAPLRLTPVDQPVWLYGGDASFLKGWSLQRSAQPVLAGPAGAARLFGVKTATLCESFKPVTGGTAPCPVPALISQVA